MLRWIKRFATPLVAVALLGMASVPAFAVPVTFSTSGVFGAAGTDVAAGAHLETASGDLELDFTGVPSNTQPPGSVNVSLGSFLLNKIGLTGTETFNAGDTFTLTITQTDPVGAPTGTSSSVVGTVVVNPGPTLDTGSLSLVFAPNPVIISNIGYFINPFAIAGSFNQPGSVSGTLTATIAAVPLPAAAWAGMALMSLVSANKFRLTRRVQV